MALGVLRAGAGALLVASGALMYAASWQRWAGVCPWGDVDSGRCLSRQDHAYDFVPPTEPWEPVGDAAQLAGSSLLVLAFAFVLLPWAITGRRPGVYSATALVGAVLALGEVGLAALRSGLAGSVVDPVSGGLAGVVWGVVPLALLIRFAVDARGWTLAAGVFLFLASPLVAMFYAIGPYDARPWWEGISGALTAAAGLSLLLSAAFDRRFPGRPAALDRTSEVRGAGGRPPTVAASRNR